MRLKPTSDYFGVKKSDLIEENLASKDEQRILLLARHLEKIPADKREILISNFENTIDIYLEALNIKKED